ncbi:glycosyltransferase family 8 protein [Aerococcus urinaeequi]|uniref:glycosyltransferase family 8 protein n=1 Tax=Aerococcus urinaeequi TaxID=51665 RepID=UPI003B3AB5BE
MDLLFTLDEDYLSHLKVTLLSIRQANPHTDFRIWLVHESISSEGLKKLRTLTDHLAFDLQEIQVDGSQWNNAKTEDRYPKEMYFRLLAGEILPADIHKVLYLDPDILVINPLDALWDKDLGDELLAAATHTGLTEMSTRLNKVRLDLDHVYYNSGVMLMNLDRARQVIKWADIQETIDKYNNLLILPDQDILNHLYGKYAVEIPEEIWNYDTRKYMRYLTKSLAQHDIHWVMANTAILHFCGGPKPWDEKHDNRFTSVYLDYQNKLDRLEDSLKV